VAVGGSANANTIETSLSTYLGAGSYGVVADNSSGYSGTVTVTVACVSGSGVQALAKDASAAPISQMSRVLARLRSERP
jgi:hypothetical protein